jgi:hypothetical protein
MSLSACTSAGKLAVFEPGDAPAGRRLPSVCEAFLQPADIAGAITPKTDARIAFGLVADAYVEDTSRIVAAKSCLDDERKAFAPKKAPERGPAK